MWQLRERGVHSIRARFLNSSSAAFRADLGILRTSIGAALVSATILLAACAKQDNGEINWARAALERNPQLKVLAVDTAKNTIQVRVKATGETLVLTPGELAAMPIGDLIALTSAPVETAIVATSNEPANEVSAVPAADTAAIAPVTQAAAQESPKPEYTVQREDGRIRVTGPGVSIESHKPSAQTEIPVAQSYDEPIVCDGKRLLHVDNKRIKVAGDAIVARGGCELHLTNSRITAGGTGVTVLDATVHIVNSEITGADGSLTTSSAARVLLRNSKFTGLARRDSQAAIQDQGGNTWR